MSDKIRWGILSTANIGRGRVIPAIHQSNNGQVAAVASRNLEKAQAFATATNIPTAYGSYEALIEDPNIDAIYIPVPNSEHAEWSIRCAEASKATLCEKPLASNATEAQRIVDAFAARQVLFAEAFMYRFHPQTTHVKRMLADGAIGDLQTISATFTFPLRSEENIRLSKTLAGGAVMDVGCYCINVMRLMTGEEPIQAKAVARLGVQTEVDESLAGTLIFPSGVVGHFDCSLRAQRVHTYDLRGTEGRILVEEAFVPTAESATKIRVWQGDRYQEITTPPINQYTLMVEDFADALLSNRPPRFKPQDAVANMQVIDALLASARGKE